MLEVGLALLLLGVTPPEAVGVPGCAPEAGEAARRQAQERLKAGQEHIAAGRPEQGEQALREALRFDPASPLPHYALGEALASARRFPEAVAAYTGAREAWRCLREGDPEARARYRRRVDEQLQQLRTALAQLERQRLKESSIPWQEVNRGAKTTLGQSAAVVLALERQIDELQRLRDQPEREPLALTIALGNAQFNAGALAEAEREFRSVLFADPAQGEAHNNLAVVLMLLGRLDEAEREVKAAKQAGVEVAPRLEDEIRKRRKGQRPQP